MPRVAWTPTAEQELGEIAFHIAVVEHRPAAADRLTDDIVAKCELYATKPHAGTPRGDLGEGFRVLVQRPYLVVYRPIDDGIEVLRVLDGRRDYRSLFP